MTNPGPKPAMMISTNNSIYDHNRYEYDEVDADGKITSAQESLPGENFQSQFKATIT
jgi:hypothetical protein